MAGTTTSDTLPTYDRPPVVETVLGVQFERLPALKNAHLGAFWKTLDTAEWTHIADVPPLLPQFERFTEAAIWAQFQLQLTDDPSYRLQVRNNDGNRMIQIQNGRLHFNWMKGADGTYPRYENIYAEFAIILERFLMFLADEKLGDLRPNQWEVTYVNQIKQGTVWNTPSDWSFFRPLGSTPEIDGVITGESFAGEWHFEIPAKRGRLHVGLQHGKIANAADKNQLDEIRLTLTARGALDDAAIGTIKDGLDLGRATIVKSFRGLMSDNANAFWGLNK